MPRPTKERRILEPPKIQGMKPMGVPARFLECVYLALGEYEAIRLADYDGLDHREAAEIMGVSRPTFTRLIEKARKKVAEAIVGVKELLIEGGNYSFSTQLQRCMDCGEFERFESTDELVSSCRNCGSTNIVHLNEWFGGRGGRGCGKRGGHRGGHGH
ncbi:DUF134 domain-containing protein [bacterium]|nr:DUF134 domain-containing protein [bacterium]MBU1873853.1 DUF134 domain-containing protein [bacterium]